MRMIHSTEHVSRTEDQEVFIKKGTLWFKMDLRTISYIEAPDNFVTLYTGKEKFPVHFTLDTIETLLPSGIFTRIHRSYIVNKSMIVEIYWCSLDLLVGKRIKNLPVDNSLFPNLLVTDRSVTSADRHLPKTTYRAIS